MRTWKKRKLWRESSERDKSFGKMAVTLRLHLFYEKYGVSKKYFSNG